jgi:hypothetical protein
MYTVKVSANMDSQRILLRLKMLLPFLGAIGNVRKNASTMHIVKIVLQFLTEYSGELIFIV